MNLLNDLFHHPQVLQNGLAERFALILLVAFITGQLNAWCYKWTHRGVSYSRTFTQALVLISIAAALSMSLVAVNSLVAIGLLGGMAIIRFRTVVRDARDTAYVFLCLVCGIAAGFGYYEIAVFGSIVANLVACYLHLTGFGAWNSGDSLLRFECGERSLGSSEFDVLLNRYCRRYSVVSVDETPAFGGGEPIYQYAYKIRLRDVDRGPDLVSEMRESFRIEAVHLLVDQEHEEVS